MMGIYRKLMPLLITLWIGCSILYLVKKTRSLFVPSNPARNSLSSSIVSSFTCETWKNFSYIDIPTYNKCLQADRNDAFWSVEEIRYTIFKDLLNSSSLIIEIGGNTGDDTSKYVELYNPFLISFEPFVQLSKKLTDKFQTNPKIIIQPYGLGSHARNLLIKSSDTTSLKIHPIQILDIVQVIKNIRQTRTSNGMIDMITINCKGCELEILPALIQHNMIEYFHIIQFATYMNAHNQSSCIYCQIEQALERTHLTKYRYLMLWEAWILKNKL